MEMKIDSNPRNVKWVTEYSLKIIIYIIWIVKKTDLYVLAI